MVQQRRPVLAFIFFFDIAVYLFRLAVKHAMGAGKEASVHGLLYQMGNMLAMYTLVSLFNWRQRRSGTKCEGQVSLAACGACLFGFFSLLARWSASVHGLLYQMGNMLAMYTLVSLFNWCQRHSSSRCEGQVSTAT